MEKILGFINSLLAKKNLIIFILLAVVAFLVMSKWQSCSSANEDKKIAEQNLEAMKKVITVEKNKNGELQSTIVAFVGKTGDLETYSKSLKEEVDALKNRKPSIIIKPELVYIHDTVKIANTLTDNGNGNYDLNWDYTSKDSSRTIEGVSSFKAVVDLNRDLSYKLKITPGTTSINKDMLKIGLVVGVAKNKQTGFDEIFVTPKDTNIKITALEGAILNRKKEKKFSVGPMIGYGLSYGAGRISTGPFIGIGVQYSLFKF